MTMNLTRRAVCAGLAGTAGLGALPLRASEPERLTARIATAQLAPADYAPTEVWAYDGQLPGPALRGTVCRVT